MEGEEKIGKCLKCGKVAPLYGGLCLECFRRSKPSYHLPDYIDVTVCRSCGARLKGKHWEYGGEMEEIIEDEIHSSLKQLGEYPVRVEDMDIYQGGEGLYHADVKTVVMLPGGEVATGRDAITIRIKKSLCPRCSRIHGSYYEAVIQIRGSVKEKSRLEEAVDRILEMVDNISRTDPMTFVSKLVKVRGGWDVYIGKSQSAHKIARTLHTLYGGDFISTSSIAGRKDGRELKRFTYLVRLPPWKKGDYLLLEGVPHRIEGFRGNKVTLRNIITSSRSYHDITEVETLPHFYSSEVEMEATVLYSRGDEVVVMDPVTYREVTLKIPKGWKETPVIRVLRVDEAMYLL